MLDKSFLEGLKKLCDDATPGPWNYDGCSLTNWHDRTFEMEWIPNGVDSEGGTINANRTIDGEFIAAARTAMPMLIAEVERNQWQPIDTAPKSDEILVTDGTAVAVGFWEDEIDDPESGRWMPGEWVPLGHMGVITHWMHKPTPPTLSAAPGGRHGEA